MYNIVSRAVDIFTRRRVPLWPARPHHTCSCAQSHCNHTRTWHAAVVCLGGRRPPGMLQLGCRTVKFRPPRAALRSSPPVNGPPLGSCTHVTWWGRTARCHPTRSSQPPPRGSSARPRQMHARVKSNRTARRRLLLPASRRRPLPRPPPAMPSPSAPPQAPPRQRHSPAPPAPAPPARQRCRPGQHPPGSCCCRCEAGPRPGRRQPCCRPAPACCHCRDRRRRCLQSCH